MSRDVSLYLRDILQSMQDVPEEIRTRHPGVPWKEMAGMRDKVIHFYFGVDVESVWLVATDRVPALRPLIAQALADLDARK